MPRAQDITICLVGFEKHNAKPDLSDPSGFWLLVKTVDASPFLWSFKTAPDVFHEFQVEHRIGKTIRTSTLMAQIVKIEDRPIETRILIRPHSSYGALDF